MEPERQGESAPSSLRRLRLRFGGRCLLCGADLAKGVEALYDPATRTVRCVECEVGLANPEARPIEPGSAGASAHREYERRRLHREERVKAQLGDFFGGAALAIAGEPQSTRAWDRGSAGERKLAEALAGVEGLIALHDRRVPGTRGNIDHILIAAGGVFVVDAKHYSGLIQVRDRGGLLDRDERLCVGRRDCSELAANMTWQTAAVTRVLESIGPAPVHAILCFVDGEWPLLLPPKSYKGVRLEGTRSIRKLLAEPGPLDAERRAQIGQALAIAFPAK